MSGFFLIIAGLGYFFTYFFQIDAIFIYTLIFALVWITFSYFSSDKVALSLSHARKLNKENPKELMAQRMVDNLCISQGIKTPRVFMIDDLSMNAFSTGRKEDNATIVFTVGLLNNLDKKEIEGVAAHELSHIKNKDILVMTVVVALIGIIAILSDLAIRTVFFSNKDKKHPAIYLIAIALGIVTPIIAKIIQFSISQKREFLADSSAVLMTRYPEGLKSALEKISLQGIPLKHQNTATAHLYISNPTGNKKSFFTNIFSTHPPVNERIAALKKM